MGGNARQSGQQAVGELFHACYRRLTAQLYAFTNDLAEAQDAVQEAFARALARPAALADVQNPEAWLRTVAINVARRRWRRRHVLDTILLRDRPTARLVQPGPEPDQADLRAALSLIPRPFREVVVLHYLGDLSVDEVARTLDIPVGTVKSRLSRGRAALANRLDGYRDARQAPSAGPRPPEGGPAANGHAGGHAAGGRGRVTTDETEVASA